MVTADDYAVLIDPTCILRPTSLPLGRGDCYRGRLRFANRPYSTLLVPGPSETPSRVEPSHLAAGEGCRAGIRQRRYRPWLSLPQCAADPGLGKGANGHPLPSYGADGARSTDIVDSSVRIDRFFALVQSYGRTPRAGRGVRPWRWARQSVNGVVFPRPTPFSHLSGVPRVG